MNKIEDIKNCLKKIPVYKFQDSNENIQLLLDEKLLFYTKIIANECDFKFDFPNNSCNIVIAQGIEMEENFKKKIIIIIGTKTLPFDKVKSIVDDNICIECWNIRAKNF